MAGASAPAVFLGDGMRGSGARLRRQPGGLAARISTFSMDGGLANSSGA
jgi:hypothetical protein